MIARIVQVLLLHNRLPEWTHLGKGSMQLGLVDERWPLGVELGLVAQPLVHVPIVQFPGGILPHRVPRTVERLHLFRGKQLADDLGVVTHQRVRESDVVDQERLHDHVGQLGEGLLVQVVMIGKVVQHPATATTSL
uniref:(northern house mosquito) hypothetical protein n=1 Tax=Culex pipiens TaxID=7175 RepID=A0A8D8A8D4_CULPI